MYGQSVKVYRIIRVLCLLAERPRSPEQIIDILSQEPEFDWRRYSKETIWRDVRQLKDAGIGIVYSKATGKYELKSSPIRLEFEPVELVALAVACQSISEETGLPYAKELAGVVEKISTLLSPKSKRALTGDPHFKLKLESVVDYGPHQEIIEAIRRAVSTGREIEILYYSVHSDKEEKRIVDPYDLYFSEGGVRLEGYCHLKREIREFRVDRIRKLKILPSTAGPSRNGDAFTFKLWLDPKLTKSVGERFPGQEIELNEDGSSILTAQATNPFRVILRVLAYGERAKILSPDFLKNQMKTIVERMAELYSEAR
ncbi:MAG: WYL domain-containing protein [Actinobacteria bacterium]|nr:WYL domain-containing protein [Actinomycetota bacterium]